METAAWVVEKEFGGQVLAAPILSSGQYVPGKQVKQEVRGLIPFPYFPFSQLHGQPIIFCGMLSSDIFSMI